MVRAETQTHLSLPRPASSHTHSLEALHHVFMKLDSGAVFCLPDGYQVHDPSLDDIRFVVDPRFEAAHVAEIDKRTRWSRGLDGSECVGVRFRVYGLGFTV